MSVILTTEVIVKQKPISVDFECPHCKKDVQINYQDFCIEAGEPCDWNCSTIYCPECEGLIEIDGIDWC